MTLCFLDTETTGLDPRLREDGHDIPDPDHTAAGDVAVTRSVFYALKAV